MDRPQARFDSLGNGAVWGMVTGVGTMAVLASVFCQNDCGGGGVGAAILAYGAMGAGIGVGVDAMIVRRVVIYERQAGSLSFGIAPLLDNGQRGFRLSMKF